MNFDNDLQDPGPQEREISLGTSTILGIFFVLALVCAGFFGFGYTMGRRSALATTPLTADAKTDAKADTKPDTTFSNFKQSPPPAADAADSAADTQPSAPATVASAKPEKAGSEEQAGQPTQAAAFPMPVASSDGQFLVQVSAATRQDDAANLVAALKRKGYTANIRHEADSRFHVLVGPFANKADAEVVRKRLDADGYKGPFIK